MKKALIAILAVIGVLSILAVMMVAGLGLLAAMARPVVPSRVVLEIDFERGLIESVPDDPFAQMMLEEVPTIRDIVDALDRGAADRRVQGLIARIGAGGMGLAHIQEIRDAIMRFRESGKPAIAFSETFGEFAPGNGGYYLATAFDEIHLQPTGDVGLTGLMYQSMFIRGALDKLDVLPDMGQRYEYKNAMNMYTHTEFTDAHREAMQALVDSQFSQVVRGIAQARQLDQDRVRELVDAGPYDATEALEAGLVDQLSYGDEIYDRVLAEAGTRARLLYVKPYLERAGRPHNRGTTVALVHGYGQVARGRSAYSPLTGSTAMGSDTVAAALRSAIDDRRVKAIVFRVDSPGGSFVASDTIWRETIRAREAGKPLIVSMGNLAASGGYFVSMDATKIVAQPGTITASIGVLGGKLITGGLWNRLGVTFDDVHSSANGPYWSAAHPYEGRGRERFEHGLDRIYEAFTTKVASGRGLPLERVQEIAKGRVWTGEEALELGLVDELGGFDAALGLVREALELDQDAPLRLKRFPRRRTAWDSLLGQRPDSSNRAMVQLARSLHDYQPMMRALAQLASLESRGVLSMPELMPAN